MRGAVIDSQARGAAANIDPELLPREWLLEDPLAEVTGEEESVWPAAAKRCDKTQLRNADVLRFVDDDVVEDRTRHRLQFLRESREEARLGHQLVGGELGEH